MLTKSKNFIGTIVATAMALAATASHAAIDATALDTALAGVTTDANTVFDSVLPVVIGVLALSIGLKLVKRFSNKI